MTSERATGSNSPERKSRNLEDALVLAEQNRELGIHVLRKRGGARARGRKAGGSSPTTATRPTTAAASAAARKARRPAGALHDQGGRLFLLGGLRRVDNGLHVQTLGLDDVDRSSRVGKRGGRLVDRRFDAREALRRRGRVGVENCRRADDPFFDSGLMRDRDARFLPRRLQRLARHRVGQIARAFPFGERPSARCRGSDSRCVTRAASSSPPVAITAIAPVPTMAARLYWVGSCLSGVSCDEWYHMSGQVMNMTAGMPCCM